jgi:hypothetical protein
MCKDYDYVFDLSKLSGSTSDLAGVVRECTAARAPPLTPTPADFGQALSTKSFSSKSADEGMVAKLYEAKFNEQMGMAEALMYGSLEWGDAEVVVLCKVLVSGALAKLERLDLTT